MWYKLNGEDFSVRKAFFLILKSQWGAKIFYAYAVPGICNIFAKVLYIEAVLAAHSGPAPY